jgi:hypothetical protein
MGYAIEVRAVVSVCHQGALFVSITTSNPVETKLLNASIHELFATGHAAAWSRYASTQFQNPGSFGLLNLRLLIYFASPAFKPSFDLGRVPVRLLVTPDTFAAACEISQHHHQPFLMSTQLPVQAIFPNLCRHLSTITSHCQHLCILLKTIQLSSASPSAIFDVCTASCTDIRPFLAAIP